MPMIEVTAPKSLIPHSAESKLLSDLTATLIKYEGTGGIPQFVANTGATLHVVPKDNMLAGGKPADVVRIVILTPPQILKQKQRQAITTDFTQSVAKISNNPELAKHTWVQFTEAVDGGWGVGGHAYTNAELQQAAVQGLLSSVASPFNVSLVLAALASSVIIGKRVKGHKRR